MDWTKIGTDQWIEKHIYRNEIFNWIGTVIAFIAIQSKGIELALNMDIYPQPDSEDLDKKPSDLM